MRSVAARCAAGVLVLAGVLVPAEADAPHGDRLFFVNQTDMHEAPVVFVVLDELPTASLMDRDGGIDESLFPGFARLARVSTWYRNATSSQTFTKEALPALLTGSYPIRRLHTTFTYPRSIFSLLGGSYEIRAADVRAYLCPSDVCHAATGMPPVQRFRGFGAGEKGALFLSFLGHLEEPDRPRLHFLHIVVPHGPWRYLPSGQRYDEVDPMPGEVDRRGRGTSWSNDRWLVTQGYQRHLLQTRLVDRLVGALIVKLKRTGLWDEALLVVTADHGIGWEPGMPKRLPREETAATLAGVPLFVKAPGQRTGSVTDVPADTVDVLPTIADLLDATTWPGIDGVSLAGEGPPEERRRRVVDVPIVSLRKSLRAAVREKHAMFGEGDLWRVAPGPARALIGLRRRDFHIEPARDVTAHTSSLERLVAADPDAHAFPSFFEGTFDGVDDGRRPLVAVMVNGRIVAVTRAYESHELVWFGAMLRPGAFTDGDDRVRLFLVDDVGGRRLIRLPLR
jgi:hypothetical protein